MVFFWDQEPLCHALANLLMRSLRFGNAIETVDFRGTFRSLTLANFEGFDTLNVD